MLPCKYLFKCVNAIFIFCMHKPNGLYNFQIARHGWTP